MSVLHTTVANKHIAKCKQFREFTINLINKNNCYNEMQKYSIQLNESLKDYKYCLLECKNMKSTDVETLNKKLAKHDEKIEKILSVYNTKIEGFKESRKAHREDFVKMFDEMVYERNLGDLEEADFQYCSSIVDEAMAELAIAKNKYEKTNAQIMQSHFEIEKMIKGLENKDIVIEYKLCRIPLFFKELKSFA